MTCDTYRALSAREPLTGRLPDVRQMRNRRNYENDKK